MGKLLDRVLVLDVETGIEKKEVSGPGGDANPYAGVPLVMVGWKCGPGEPEVRYWDGPGTRPPIDPLILDVEAIGSDGTTSIVVGHNVNFDLHHIFFEHTPEQVMDWLADWTIWDTQTVEYYLTGQRVRSPSLVSLEEKYLNGGRTIAKNEVHELFEAGIGSDKIDRATLQTYLEEDLVQTERVFMSQVKVAQQLGMLQFLREMMDAQLMSFIMEKEGLPINLDTVPKIQESARIELERSQLKLTELLPQIMSGDTSHMDGVTNYQLARMLVGHPIEVKWKYENGVYKSGQKKGQVKYNWASATLDCEPPPIDVRKMQGIKETAFPSTSEKSLAQIGARLKTGLWGELFSAVLAVRAAEKKHGTYATGYLGKVCPDGQLRTSINQSITATGRVSSSNVNLQNVGDV